jgi:inner membrane protein YidH
VKSRGSESAPVQEEKKGTELLANERTFLAWIRTSVAVLSLGFLIARFGLWLHEIASTIHGRSSPLATGTSLWIGSVMMAFGGLLAVLAAWRYHVVNRAIEKGRVSSDRGLVVLVTVAVFLLAAVMILYMWRTAG